MNVREDGGPQRKERMSSIHPILYLVLIIRAYA